MKKRSINKIIHSKFIKQIISGMTAIAIVSCAVPMGELSEGVNEIDWNFFGAAVLKASAEEYDYPHASDSDPTVRVEVSKLSAYSEECAAYRSYHQNDNLIILGSSGNTNVFSSGFMGLGSDECPFGGSVTIDNNADITLNLDAPLFNCVYDDITINNGNYLQISREYGENIVETTPILAEKVKHRGTGGATWNININKPQDDAVDYYLGTFGGLIGTMVYEENNEASEEDKGAKLTVNVTMNVEGGDSAAATIHGDSDLGFFCGEMQEKTELTVTLSSTRGVGEISTTSGNVGGLVGSMAEGSSFTYTGSNPQTITANSKNIKTDASGYAGGIIGKNDKGIVNLNTEYLIGQTIQGALGAGGVYGYYKPSGTTAVTISTDSYIVSGTSGNNTYNCQVNGTGNVGGLIGELDCGNDITLSGTNSVASNHALVKANCYGGLIGKYTNTSGHTLTVGNLNVTTANAGGAGYYGGCVGEIDAQNALYASFINPTVTSLNAGTLTYGGLVACADNAFIDVNGAAITASDFKGGGLVGSLDHGVLCMDGAVNLTNAAPAAPTHTDTVDETDYVGRIVGWRDDALVYGKSTCTLTKPSTEVDDIGAWGQVIKFYDYTVSQQQTDPETGEPVMVDVLKHPNISESDMFTISGHQITIKAPSDTTDSYKKIANENDFAKTALCFQIDASNNDFVSFENATCTYSTINSQNITLAADIDLTNTGFTGLTRDNDIGTVNGESRVLNGDKCTYSGTFDGKTTENSVDTIHSITYGGETVYRHAYNGLIGIANNASVTNTDFEGEISVNANEAMYVGSAAAAATGTFTAKGLTVNTTLSHAGASDLVIGGVLGEGLSGVSSITIGGTATTVISGETVVTDKVTANADITGSASGDVCLGGVIGQIVSPAGNIQFTNVDTTGCITNSALLTDNQVGGLVAVISGSGLKTSEYQSFAISKVNADNFNINIKAAENGTVGGLLGYSWQSINVDFDQVEVKTDSSITNTGSEAGVDFSGLVYCGTGYWTVKDTNDLKISSFALNSNNAQSVGMIVNKGWSGTDSISSALYLELQSADAYSLTSSAAFKKSDGTTNMIIPIFDELVAHTAFYTGSGASKVHYSGTDQDNLYVTQNGQAVVSIQTANSGGGIIMDGTSASGTYTPSTTFGQQMNPCSRYYYNLYSLNQTVKNETEQSPAPNSTKLMVWAARWYANSSIKDCFETVVWSGNTIPNETYDLEGYSWYPLNIDTAAVTINGTFKLYNREFELSEAVSSGDHVKRTSLYNNGTTQHYLLHSALFNNMGGSTTQASSLTVGNVTLQGSIPQIDTRTYEEVEGKTEQTGDSLYSGALVRGTVKGTGATSETTAKITINNVVLDGVYVYNFDLNSESDYAPLLINKTDSFTTLAVNGVKVNADTSYKTNTELKDTDGYIRQDTNSIRKIATSLIGDVGNKDATNVNINFTNIKLDGRSSNSAEPDLNAFYHTEASLFTKATLLNKLAFATGKGTYTYNFGDDWNNTGTEQSPVYAHDADHIVTYGAEVSYTASSTQYPGKEHWYLDKQEDNSNMVRTHPTNSNDVGNTVGYDFSGFLPYVATDYNSGNKEYQLEVNHASSKFGGCGTYNDPYILTSKADFLTIYNILSTSNDVSPGSVSINIPMKSAAQADLSATWHKEEPGKKHASYSFKVVDPSDSNHKAGYYLDDNYANECLTPQAVRTYVAGAYFKIEPADSIDGRPTITIDGDDFKGFGYTTDNFAQFRGVIVGTGNETIINKTNSPLIAISNGSVVKDVNITVDKGYIPEGETDLVSGNISLAENKVPDFSATSGNATAITSSCYGAVFGSVLGGDNIIDGVNVTFQNTTITLSGTYAQLVPVGGYVGVIEKGGVIFRGMEGETGISGLPTGVVTAENNNPGVGDSSLGDMTSETNKRWLYVNPIIGRVINGYAVTEASAYRPYEDGTRIYNGGTTPEVKYWNETSQTETATPPETLSHVTMQNGNKHYSITDIKSAWKDGINGAAGSYTNLTDGEKINLTTNNVISVPNGQAFFLMSVIVNSGMGINQLGYREIYQVSRWAQYDDVETNITRTAPSDGDYSIAKSDCINITSGNKAKQDAGYIAKYFTTKKDNAITLGNATAKSITLTANCILPDGFKGVGNIYQNTTDDTNFYTIRISEFDGNDYTVSQNSSWYYYYTNDLNTQDTDKRYVWNAEFDTRYIHKTKDNDNNRNVGFGLFNNQIHLIAISGSGVNQVFSGKGYHNCTITGNIVVDCIASDSDTGAHINYYCSDWNSGAGGHTSEHGIDRAKMVNAGGLIGVSDAALLINSVSLNNIYVHGIKNAGGLVGCIPAAQITIKNDDSKSSEKIVVHAAGSAGGMVGKVQQGGTIGIHIDNNNASYSITEVECESDDRKGQDYNYGVGGFIGACRTQDKPIEIKNITVGSPTQEKASSVKSYQKIFAGGMIGIMNKGTVTIDNCTVNNQSVSSVSNVGGLIGYWASPQNATQNIKNVIIFAKSYTNADDMPLIESTSQNAGGFLGTGKGDMRNTVIQNSSVEGYNITGKDYAGGAIGSWGDNQSEASDRNVSLNNIMIKGCTIKAEYSGGVIGRLYTTSTNKKTVRGYNILVKNTELQTTKTSDKENYMGSLCGIRQNLANNHVNCIVKIAGFSRQDDRTGDNNKMVERVIGTPEILTTGTAQAISDSCYGTDGYVIFADYNDTASTEPNTTFANVHHTNSDVDTMRSKTTVTTQTYVNGEVDDAQTTETVTYGDYKSSETDTTTTYSEGYVEGTSTDYTKTTTVVENENYPYVTSSPKTKLDSTNYITGDGITHSGNTSPLGYDNSNFKKIYTDSLNNLNKKYNIYKRYGDSAVTTSDLTTADINEIKSHYSSTKSAYSNNSNVRDFPLLEVNDVSTVNTTRLINNYINVLANTNYNYADTRNSRIYEVKFYKYRLDTEKTSQTYNQFVYKPESATNGKNCLKTTSETISGNTRYVFKMTADNVDTGTIPQFTLMDVQYFDPSDTSSNPKVAYHLYIPVYVNKLLLFNFSASVASNTDYYPTPYAANERFMFENLGNPVTIKFDYSYQRSPSEWAQFINDGFNVNTNYYKTLTYKTHTTGTYWPADTRLVLVDASNKDKYYYMDDPNTNCHSYIDLYDFMEKDETTHFQPAPLQNLMSLSAIPFTGGNLVETTNNTSTGATVCIDGQYYRPIEEGETGTTRIVTNMQVNASANGATGELVRIGDMPNNTATVFDGTYYYRPATDDENNNTNIPKYNTLKNIFGSETYYLSIFTKENDNDNAIYHYEVSSRETFESNSAAAGTNTGWTQGSGWQPNKMRGNNTSIHIIMGNLYENDLAVEVSSLRQQNEGQNAVKGRCMDDDNYYLTVTMTSTVKLKQAAITGGVPGNMENNPNSPIYQGFLMTYDTLSEVGGQSILGIEPDAGAWLGSDKVYTINVGDHYNEASAVNVDNPQFLNDSSTYIEIRNNTKLGGKLYDSTNNYAVTFRAKFDIGYASKYLSYQFPKRQNDNDDVGAKVVGYSGISSSNTGVAYSSTLRSKEDYEIEENGVIIQAGHRYYTDDDTKAILNYDVVQTKSKDEFGTPNPDVYGGKYSYLGINAYESNITSSFVDTFALYDIRDIQNPGDFIEFTLSLSQSGAYLKPAAGSPHSPSESYALDITEYLQNLKIYGKDLAGSTNMDVLYDMNQDMEVNPNGTGNTRTGTLQASLNQSKNMLTIRVHKSLLRTQGSANSNIYMLPITYEVKTGDALFNSNTGGLKYSNYKVSVTAAAYPAMNSNVGDYTQSSYAFNHLIYTNTKVNPNVIE